MDLIERQAAIDALKNDKASLDHIIRGMSANDVRLDAYVSQRNQVNYDIDTINNLPTAQPEQLGTDCISRAAAIDALDKRFDSIPLEQTAEILLLRKDLRELPPAQPEPLLDAYVKSVYAWLLDYQVKAAELLSGRYAPHEVLSWVANDWRKEHERSNQQTGD